MLARVSCVAVSNMTEIMLNHAVKKTRFIWNSHTHVLILTAEPMHTHNNKLMIKVMHVMHQFCQFGYKPDTISTNTTNEIFCLTIFTGANV